MMWTPDQRRAITSLAPRICVDAGAGSGKTRVLVDRIVYLIEAGHADLDDIVAITFTDKAAGEMKARLRQAFRDKATPDDAEAMSRWRDLERRVESARISTIHSFCTVLLRENALHQGMDPDFAVMNDADGALLLQQVVTETFFDLLEQTDDAAMGLGETFGAARVTDTLKGMIRKQSVVERAAPAHWSGDADTLLAHWREAEAEETQRRLAALAHDPSVARMTAELEGFAGRCEREGDPRETLRRALLDVLDALTAGAPAETIERLANAQQEIGLRGSGKKYWGGEETYAALSEAQAGARDWVGKHLVEASSDLGDTRQSARLTTALCDVYRRVADAWGAAKAESNAVDFDDLIDRARRVLENDPELCRRVAEGIRFLLMDEFQDTDTNQLAIARALSGVSGGPSLFIVGDAKQSIYYFRGAEVEVFSGERAVAAEVIPLDQNFRTLPDVLAFVNDFFEKTDALHHVERPFTRLGPHRDAAGDQRVEFLIPEADDAKLSAEEGRRREAELIAGRVAELCGDDGPKLVWDEERKAFRPGGYGDVALLLRSMSNIHLYEAALRRRGIPYALVAGAGFYACQEVMDVLSLVRTVLDPSDEPSVTAFLRGPLAGLSDEDLLRLARRGGIAKAFAETETPASFADPDILTAARALVAELRAGLPLPPPAFLRLVLTKTKFETVLLGQYLGVQKVSNLRKLLEQAESFAEGRTPSVRAFARYLEEIRLHGIREGEALLQAEGAVSIMTIHRSKGLEFPLVFVGDMSRGREGGAMDDLFVHRSLGLALKSIDDMGERATPPMGHAIKQRVSEEEEAEHARLLYVALTRARDYLVMSGSPDPRGSNWLSMLDDASGVLSRGEGERFHGLAWKAVVRRKSGAPLAPVRTERNTDLVPDALPKHLDKPEPSASPRRTWSISAVLDAMMNEVDQEDERPRDLEEGHETPEAHAAASRGTLVHRLFERWDFGRDPAPLLPELVAEGGVPPSQRDAVMNDLRAVARAFSASEMGARMAAERTVLREQPFVLRLDDALISGTIDAILADGTVIDYKTGQYRKESHQRYAWQLCLYAKAVADLRGQAPKTAYLCYVDSGEAHAVDLGKAVLKDAVRRARVAIAAMGNVLARSD